MASDLLLLPEYAVWRGIKQRCYNPRAPSYKYYGAKGIQMYDGWRYDFWAFLRDVGEKPDIPGKRFSLDRFPNNTGNYEPGNVRWATDTEQMHNRSVINCRNNVKLTWGQVREIRSLNGLASIGIIAFDFGVSKQCIHDILHGKTWKEEYVP